eukprot:TRINITY_DN11647_c0_g1_i1.p1 TRINITY_DN11647_c0_g1~~TRINITY_DN11647_c0_g1_i1.p1  ORF type:complete len:100 (-),score=12.18 TRINITY_DN11647_c0_g1_i1:3-302(-)
MMIVEVQGEGQKAQKIFLSCNNDIIITEGAASIIKSQRLQPRATPPERQTNQTKPSRRSSKFKAADSSRLCRQTLFMNQKPQIRIFQSFSRWSDVFHFA